MEMYLDSHNMKYLERNKIIFRSESAGINDVFNMTQIRVWMDKE